MTTEEILEAIKELADGGDEILLADGFEDALVGIVSGACRPPVACYDYHQCVEILMARDGIGEEEAVEFLDFNTINAYVGEYTPLFLDNLRAMESRAELTALVEPPDGA